MAEANSQTYRQCAMTRLERADLDDGDFDFARHRTAVFFATLNGHLPEPLRLPADLFDWLSR